MNKERIKELRDFLEKLPDERFGISAWMRVDGSLVSSVPDELREARVQDCGTAACIAGWAELLFGEDAADGLDIDGWGRLIMPTGWSEPGADERYTRARAVATLDRLLETGEVDWGPDQ